MNAPATPELGEDLVSSLLKAAGGIDADAKASADPVAGVTGQPSAPPAALAPAPVDWTAEAREVVELATEGFFPLYPRLAEVWTDEKLERLNVRLGAVMQKYDLTLGKILGRWAPEIMLAAVTIPAVVPTYRVIRDTNRELREKAKAEQQGAQLAPLERAKPAAASDQAASASSAKPQAEFTGPPPAPDLERLDLRT